MKNGVFLDKAIHINNKYKHQTSDIGLIKHAFKIISDEMKLRKRGKNHQSQEATFEACKVHIFRAFLKK